MHAALGFVEILWADICNILLLIIVTKMSNEVNITLDHFIYNVDANVSRFRSTVMVTTIYALKIMCIQLPADFSSFAGENLLEL